MKIAVSGKGGVGKTTLSAFLVRWFAEQGKSVLAIDADPDANLAHALGIENGAGITPISQMKELVAERTESVPGSYGGFFKLNPRVDDLPEKLSIRQGENIRLMVMGGVKKGGTGCVCPESILLKNLVQHLILRRNEVVIMDMEAGIEHLGRGTSKAVDWLISVVEPGRRSIETAARIRELGTDIGLTRIGLVGNKVRNDSDRDFLRKALSGQLILGFIPYDDLIIEADLKSQFAENVSTQTRAALERIVKNLLEAAEAA
ncbi:MAG: carbon monoxide dehydrogenase accessory protein CooC [Deltaproteobacteria bacterium]|nr:carbon monoxide dehydrogenase accessory protein CooC [Deltaproteobacteria bacterium]MDA8307708.1 carbon monoxide dehydrogenase accessory protein CooC [Deltaproteobacteria bacterium]